MKQTATTTLYVPQLGRKVRAGETVDVAEPLAGFNPTPIPKKAAPATKED